MSNFKDQVTSAFLKILSVISVIAAPTPMSLKQVPVKIDLFRKMRR